MASYVLPRSHPSNGAVSPDRGLKRAREDDIAAMSEFSGDGDSHTGPTEAAIRRSLSVDKPPS